MDYTGLVLSERPGQVLILGAGFSRHAGLPLQSGFTKALLAARSFPDGRPSKILADYLCGFVHDAFGHAKNAKACFWPALEDLFTCVDLSANTGHYLGQCYSPSDLRTVRRALIVRIVRMLREKYRKCAKGPTARRKRLVSLLANLDLDRTTFLSLNWDVALEAILGETHQERYITYCAGERNFDFERSNGSSLRQADALPVKVAKMHGSVNWLYCDNCRTLYATPPNQTNRIAEQLLSDREWDVIGKVLNTEVGDLKRPRRECPGCPGVFLGTRIATFSYRKALDFPMFQKTWYRSEGLLTNAGTWVFIGYSLPAADFEFKYLLKRVELARRTKPRILVVTGGDENARRTTIENYQRFFGDRISLNDLFEHEIDETVIRELA